MDPKYLEGLTEATIRNIKRKAHYIDRLSSFQGLPIPTWIDLNVTELCNRKCEFCPRGDDALYPNQPLHISAQTASVLASNLEDIGYRGIVTLSGYGEPLLHPQLPDIVKLIKRPDWTVEVVTNGDKLTPASIRALIEAGVSYFVVSLYDGPHQIEQFDKMFADAGAGDDKYLLRDRWYNEDDGYGLKLTSRVGNIQVQAPNTESREDGRCFYLTYSMSLDWNGDVLLCVQDWDKKVKFGNIHQSSLHSIWTSSAFMKRRLNLIRGNRSSPPCSKCDANGKVHGSVQAVEWGRCVAGLKVDPT